MDKEVMSREEIREFIRDDLFSPFAAQIERIINRFHPQEQLDTRALEIAQAALTKSEAVSEQINQHLQGHDRFYTEMRDSFRRIHERLETRDGTAFKVLLASLVGALGIVGWFIATKGLGI